MRERSELMEKTKTIGRQKVRFRGLTWGEKKQLKENGHDISNINEQINNDDLVDAVNQLGVIDPSADALGVTEAYQVFFEIIKMTFVGGSDSKNSKRR
jgi:hypothetical protein